jgi:hypothetical protein
MRTDNPDISSDERLVLQNLQALLEKQIELAGHGDIRNVEAVVNQADSIVTEIIDSGMLERPEFQAQREQLQKLYKDLLLVFTTQKAETAGQLSWLRKSRKTLKAYRSNI